MTTDIIMCPCCGRSVFVEDAAIKPHGPGRDGETLCTGSNRVIDRLKVPAASVVKDVKP